MQSTADRHELLPPSIVDDEHLQPRAGYTVDEDLRRGLVTEGDSRQSQQICRKEDDDGLCPPVGENADSVSFAQSHPGEATCQPIATLSQFSIRDRVILVGGITLIENAQGRAFGVLVETSLDEIAQIFHRILSLGRWNDDEPKG